MPNCHAVSVAKKSREKIKKLLKKGNEEGMLGDTSKDLSKGCLTPSERSPGPSLTLRDITKLLEDNEE